ncbi:MAG: hypothetical protein IKS18_05670 [Lachnospiraceae bacterium]|nr:hypothetical protein [Lachnospiraceae bacterium]
MKRLPGTMMRGFGILLRYQDLSIDQTDSMIGSAESNAMFEEMTAAGLYSKEIKPEAEIASYHKAYFCMNLLSALFRYLYILLAAASAAGFVFLWVEMIRGRKKNESELAAKCLVTTALLLSEIVFLTGVSYNEIASCETLVANYLSAGYLLVFLTEILTILCGAERLVQRLRRV